MRTKLSTSVFPTWFAVIMLVAYASCGVKQATRPAHLFSPECEIVPVPSTNADTVTLALAGTVDPDYGPWARNAGERRLFGHLYETLIYVDCQGDVQPRLAVSWDRGVDGRQWTFGLQKGARFWDGSPVTASSVVWSWQNAPVDPDAPNAVFDSVKAGGERTLRVYLKQPYWEVPRAFSSLTFAVAKPSPGTGWPLGSGPYEIDPSPMGSSGKHVQAILLRPAFGARGPIIRVLQTSTHDTRDLLEETIDVVVTDDPAVIEYASHRPHLDSVALPWDRTYVLLSTSRVRELLWGGSIRSVPADLTDDLARDAVRGDARGVRPPFWWEELGHCGELSETVSGLPPFPRGAYSSGGARRIMFDLQDPTARDIAERLVALAAADTAASTAAAALASAVPGLNGGSSALIAKGVSARELRLSLQSGNDFAYVVVVYRRPPDSCDEAGKLLQRAPWLAPLGDGLSRAPIPLVDTRNRVIVRSGVAGLVVDWYGNLIVANETLQRR
jgi:hypothetical protein